MNSVVYAGTALFIAGLLLAEKFGCEYNFLPVLAVMSLCLITAAVMRREILIKIITVIVFFMGGVYSGISTGPAPEELLHEYNGANIQAYGNIIPDSVKNSEYGTSFILKCEKIIVGEKNINYRDSLKIFIRQKVTLKAGSVVCNGTLNGLTGFNNPGGFDYKKWNYIHGIGGFLQCNKVIIADEKFGIFDKLMLMNMELRNFISSRINGDIGYILAGMVLGGSSYLGEDVKKVFSDNGLTHLLAVSGSNMVLLASLLLLVLGNLKTSQRNAITGVFLIFYAGLCGFQPPVCRAVIMSLVLLYTGKHTEKGVLLCLTAVIMLIFKPVWLYDIGFQLSFGAAAGLIFIMPKIRLMLSAFLPVWLSEGIAVTCAAQLSVLPFLIGYFHQISIISIISNIVLVPVMEISVLLTLAGSLLAYMIDIGDFLMQAAAFLMEQIIVQADLLAKIPFSVMVFSGMPLWAVSVYYFLLVIFFDLPCVQFLENAQRKILIAFLSCTLLFWVGYIKFYSKDFTVYFLDVGQGDCAVVVSETGKTAVIDTGGLKNYDTGSKILVPFLYSLGKTKIDYLLLSHGDYDHAGGCLNLTKWLDINCIILAQAKLTDIEKQLLNSAPESKIEFAKTGNCYRLGDKSVLKIIDAPPEDAEGNDASIVAEVSAGKQSVLFTGDIDAERESMLKAGKAAVLKVAHHGSKYSSSEEFLAGVKPEIAVISVGRNSYGHPHDETIARLKANGCRYIMRTDKMGAIKVVFDDNFTRCYSYVYQKEYF